MDEGVEHFAGFDEVCSQGLEDGLRQVGKVFGENEQVFDLAGRAHGDHKKTFEFSVRIFAAAFGNVGGDGDRRSLELTREPVGFMFRESVCGFVYR